MIIEFFLSFSLSAFHTAHCCSDDDINYDVLMFTVNAFVMFTMLRLHKIIIQFLKNSHCHKFVLRSSHFILKLQDCIKLFRKSGLSFLRYDKLMMLSCIIQKNSFLVQNLAALTDIHYKAPEASLYCSQIKKDLLLSTSSVSNKCRIDVWRLLSLYHKKLPVNTPSAIGFSFLCIYCVNFVVFWA